MLKNLRSYHVTERWKSLYTENHIFFFQMFWKDGLSKKIELEYDLSCIIRKYDISFSKKYDLILQTKNERWSFSKKRLENMIFSSNILKREPEKITLEYDLSCIFGKMVLFLPENMIFFLWTENERWSFLRNTSKYGNFYIYE